MNAPPIQCLTLDGIGLSHLEQVRRLSAAGAGWIQLRMKTADETEAAETARACLPICREAGCRLLLDDFVEATRISGADGVHLGKLDMDWSAARDYLGPDKLIGGTVNNTADARAAAACGVLDYAGVGPFRATQTKARPSPILSEEDWSKILGILGDLPAYAIGGIEAGDLRGLRARGLTGVVVGRSLHQGGSLKENYQSLLDAWRNRVSTTIKGAAL